VAQPVKLPIERPADRPLRPAAVRPTLVTAPAPESAAGVKPVDLSDVHRLVISKDMLSVSLEQYRRIATKLYQTQAESGIKKVMVSSTLPGEGKTLTVTNLALTLSESYDQRVLLVDADLRSPSVHELLRVTQSPGLGDYLAATSPNLPTVQITNRLTVVPAGNSDHPLAGLVSDRMKQFVNQAATHFDWVLLDTPPVGLLSDANLLADAVDVVVFVVGASSSSYSLVQRAVTTIGVDRILGMVLNRAEAQALPPSSYYRHYGRQ
jgi:capsular exopolysaccharide synthesis family protein